MTFSPHDISILQLTDLHLMAHPGATLLGVDTEATFIAVLQQALADSRPDLLVLSGDLAQEPVPETYLRLLQLIQQNYSGSVLLLPGNHDLSGAMLTAGIETRAFQQQGWAVMPLDTHLDDQIPGHVGHAELQRFKDTLEHSSAEHVLVVGHHPLCDVGTAWLDDQKVHNHQEMLSVFAADSRIKGYLFGHIHQAFDASFKALKLYGTPSTCFQFKAGSPTFTLGMEQPGFRRLILKYNGEIETQVERLDGPQLEVDLTDRNY